MNTVYLMGKHPGLPIFFKDRFRTYLTAALLATTLFHLGRTREESRQAFFFRPEDNIVFCSTELCALAPLLQPLVSCVTVSMCTSAYRTGAVCCTPTTRTSPSSASDFGRSRPFVSIQEALTFPQGKKFAP